MKKFETKWNKKKNYWKLSKAKNIDFVSLWSETKNVKQNGAKRKIVGSKTKQKTLISFCFEAKQKSWKLNEKLLEMKQSNKRCFCFGWKRKNWSKKKRKQIFFAWACKTDLDSLHFTLKQKILFGKAGEPYLVWEFKLQSQKGEGGQGGEGFRLGGNLGLLTGQWTVIKLKIKF